MHKYEIDILKNNEWKLLKYCNSMSEVCVTVKLIRTKNNNNLRILENDLLLEFISDDDFSLFYFIQKYEHYDNIKEMLQDQKVLGRYYKFIKKEK